MASDLHPEPEELRPARREVRAPVEPAAFDEELFGEEFDLRGLLLKGWRGKWVILATMAAALGLATVSLKTTAPLYTATMAIVPAGESGAGGLAGKLSQYGDLALLAGIKVPSADTVSPFTQFTELVTSVVVAERLVDKYGVLQKVFKGSWDAENEHWLPPEGSVARAKGWVRSFFNLPAWTPPSTQSLAVYLEAKVKVSEVARTGIHKIVFRHQDPEFAVQLLRWIHEEGDELIREEAQERATRQIEYIERKLATVLITEHRFSLTQLLSDQEKQMMMIQVDLPFAARVIEPPVVSDAPTSPKPFRLLALGVVGGFFVGILLLFLYDNLRGRQTLPRESRDL